MSSIEGKIGIALYLTNVLLRGIGVAIELNSKS